MSAIRIKKGDNVKVIAGKDKGKEGKVIAINAKKGTALVEGVNMITKHTKPSAANQNGGIIHQEGPIDISNIMLVYKGKPTKIGYKFEEGKNGLVKVRVAKATGEVID
ncbi:MAG: 50S ribosomal protein L24 [Lachnospiraceae bacterium]|nr:50S ribosomal protein L24 [Lachnospira sp.]MBQ8729678.1 50S ribosomal protein L24 [Lachnospiraceae bacterium]